MAEVVAISPAGEKGASTALPLDDASSLSLSDAIAAYHAHCVEAKQRYNGRELTLFETEPAKMGRFFDLLIEGNYRETAASIAGIKARQVRLWMQRAEDCDERYEPFAMVVRVAESLAESHAVRDVRAAGKDPRFWAASMTYLERRHPDRWGRRAESTDAPRVVVQFGATDSDITVNVVTTVATPPQIT